MQDFTMLIPDSEWSGIACGIINNLLINHKRWHFGITKTCEIMGTFIKFTNGESGKSVRRKILDYELFEKEVFKDFILVHLGGVGNVADEKSDGKLLDTELCLHTVILKESTRAVMLDISKKKHVVLRNHDYLNVSPELSSRIKSYKTEMVDKSYDEWKAENE